MYEWSTILSILSVILSAILAAHISLTSRCLGFEFHLQTTENKFYFIANGYTKEEIVRQNIKKILELSQ